MHMEYLISLTQLKYIYIISGFFYCNSHTKMYFRTYGVFINNSVLSFHFVFQRSCCSIQTINKTTLENLFFLCFTADTKCRWLKPWTATAPSGFLEPVGPDVCSDTGKASQQSLVPPPAHRGLMAWREKSSSMHAETLKHFWFIWGWHLHMEGSAFLGYDCRHILALLFFMYQMMHIGFTSIEANFHSGFDLRFCVLDSILLQ